jgi:hypothetical protein
MNVLSLKPVKTYHIVWNTKREAKPLVLFRCSPAVSRVLSWMVIYLVCPLPSDIKRLSSHGRTTRYMTLLAAGGVYLPDTSPCRTVSSYLTRFIVAPLTRGCFVSVALSLGSRPVAVNDRPVLRCPDFPLVAISYQRPSTELLPLIITHFLLRLLHGRLVFY